MNETIEMEVINFPDELCLDNPNYSIISFNTRIMYDFGISVVVDHLCWH